MELDSRDQWIELLEARNANLVETVETLQLKVKKLHGDLIDEYSSPGKYQLATGLRYYDAVDRVYRSNVEIIYDLRDALARMKP